MRSAILLSLSLLSGCTHLTVWVGVHAKEIAAVGLVAGTASQVGGALVQADEIVERAKRHIEPAGAGDN